MMAKSGKVPRAALTRSAVLLTMVVAAACNPARADTANPLSALVDAAAQRLQIAEPVAAFKWNTGAAIEDPVRVQQEVAALAGDATAEHIDPAYVTWVFTSQIAATEAVEYHRFAQWKLDSAGAPTTSPDLAASRAQIDDLNHVMMTQIGLQWGVLHSSECASRLDQAKRDVSTAHQLDEFYRQALAFATRSYCQP